MSQRLTLFCSICIVAGLCGATVSAHAADAACKPVFDAMTKMAATPNHTFMTETTAYNDESESTETITTADTMYVKAHGAWHGRLYKPEQQVDEMRQAFKTANQTCQHVRDEDVGAEPTALYSTRYKQEGGITANSQIWISKTRGLPVKQTMDMDVGGKLGKSHTDARIDYTNVQAPTGAS